MKIKSDRRPANDKALTIADVKAYLAKLEMLGVPERTRVKATTTMRSYVAEFEVDTEDVRPPQIGDPDHVKEYPR